MNPLGIRPEWIWKLERYHELGKAMERYIAAGFKISPEWVEEYNRLHEELADKL